MRVPKQAWQRGDTPAKASRNVREQRPHQRGGAAQAGRGVCRGAEGVWPCHPKHSVVLGPLGPMMGKGLSGDAAIMAGRWGPSLSLFIAGRERSPFRAPQTARE